MSLPIYLSYTELSARERALFLSEKTHIPLREAASVEDVLQLWVSPEKVYLTLKAFKYPFHVDFLSKSLQYRISHPSKERLLVACGVKGSKKPSILDAMVGWGKDAYQLIRAGCTVTGLEKSPIVYCLLEDGIRRLQEVSKYPFHCHHVDAFHYLEVLPQAQYPEVIYLDPMRPLQGQMPKSKREIEILRLLAQDPFQDEEALLTLALNRAIERVVIKRPLYYKTDRLPSFSYRGRNTRFDVYMIQ